MRPIVPALVIYMGVLCILCKEPVWGVCFMLLGMFLLFYWISNEIWLPSDNTTPLKSNQTHNHPVPVIQAPTAVHPGNEVVINWEIDDAVMVILHYNGKTQTVSHLRKLKLHPYQTTTYEFEVISPDGTSTFYPVTVKVEEPAEIIKFEANREFSFPNIPVTLSWEVVNAESVRIDNFGEQPKAGSIKVSSGIDTTYTLRVTDAFGEQSRAITINILPIPTVNVQIPAPNINVKLNTRYTTPICKTNIMVPTLESPLISIKTSETPISDEYQLRVNDIYKSRHTKFQNLFAYFFGK